MVFHREFPLNRSRARHSILQGVNDICLFYLHSLFSVGKFGIGDVYKIFLSDCTSRENMLSDTLHFTHVLSDVCEILHIML